jgi:hypothetical protein
MLRVSLGFLLFLGLLLASRGNARAFPYIVKKGDTLAATAEKVYGRIQHEKVLVAANLLDVEGGTSITPGMRLEIPALGHHRVRRGDTWASLAADLLGWSQRSDVLSIANDSSPWLTPEEGAEIVVPYNLRVVLSEGDTIVTVSYQFLGDMNKAWVLDRYNNFKGRKLHRGDVVLVPLVDLPLTERGRALAAEGAGRVCSQASGDTRVAQRGVQVELPNLMADVRGGRYVDAIRRGSSFLASGELTREQLALIHRQLLEAYAALDAHGLAAASCNLWQKHDPEARLDPLMLSPKLMKACERAAR